MPPNKLVLKLIDEHNRARDEALMGTLKEFVAWVAAQPNPPPQFPGERDPRYWPFNNRQVAEMTYHKMRTACVELPDEIRKESHQWLMLRGLSSLHGPGASKPH
jgi:hypothetical protein